MAGAISRFTLKVVRWNKDVFGNVFEKKKKANHGKAIGHLKSIGQQT